MVVCYLNVFCKEWDGMDLMTWRQHLWGDVIRAAHAEGKDCATFLDDGQAFLTGTIGFRTLCNRVGAAPSRRGWNFVDPPLQRGSTHEGVYNNSATWQLQVRHTWLWAEWAVRQAQQAAASNSSAAMLPLIAHWPLMVWPKTRQEVHPAHVLDRWRDHLEQVQKTRAEQLLIRHPAYAHNWHPYRETTGAMRRAPLWSLVYCRHWGQAQVAAVTDTVWYQSPTAAQAVAIIATAVEQGPSPSPAYDTIQREWRRQLERVPGPTVIGEALEQLEAGLAQDADRYWNSFCTRYGGCPYDHVVPNLCIVIGALWASPEDIPAAVEFTIARGFDVVGNALITATILAGVLGARAAAPTFAMVPKIIETGIQQTIAYTTLSWRF